MKFLATCNFCNGFFFKPSEVRAFSAGRVIDLEGRSPWAGVRVLCHKCVKMIDEDHWRDACYLAQIYSKLGILDPDKSSEDHFKEAMEILDDNRSND